MKLCEAAEQPFLQGAIQAVNTHLLRAKVCHTRSTPSTPAGMSHCGVLTKQTKCMFVLVFFFSDLDLAGLDVVQSRYLDLMTLHCVVCLCCGAFTVQTDLTLDTLQTLIKG